MDRLCLQSESNQLCPPPLSEIPSLQEGDKPDILSSDFRRSCMLSRCNCEKEGFNRVVLQHRSPLALGRCFSDEAPVVDGRREYDAREACAWYRQHSRASPVCAADDEVPDHSRPKLRHRQRSGPHDRLPMDRDTHRFRSPNRYTFPTQSTSRPLDSASIPIGMAYPAFRRSGSSCGRLRMQAQLLSERGTATLDRRRSDKQAASPTPPQKPYGPFVPVLPAPRRRWLPIPLRTSARFPMRSAVPRESLADARGMRTAVALRVTAAPVSAGTPATLHIVPQSTLRSPPLPGRIVLVAPRSDTRSGEHDRPLRHVSE